MDAVFLYMNLIFQRSVVLQFWVSFKMLKAGSRKLMFLWETACPIVITESIMFCI